ncbi:hypothetical protein DSM112329_01928 [Paraconexibacter sp. AEG42_29]|uniref:Uncharacterized protein n=1 Tax=Paraconexibacter sp. AEG42_29 TaxID=2997339 RepID=A0AAU7ATQ9_9ACTN
MLYERFVERVGRVRYRQACEAARATAASTGKGADLREPWPDDLEDVPHELADVWSEPGAPLDTRLDTALRFLAEMPCYANTMIMTGWFHDMTATQTARVWDAYRAALAGPDEGLAAVVAYSLWVDYFEDGRTSEDAFAAMTVAGGTDRDRRIARVLSVAGPAPWGPKRRLFDELIADQRWHADILEAVKGSLFDAYGQAGTDAGDILRRLDVPAASAADVERARDAAARIR